ncbi:hypothetical protein ACFCZC_20815 [Bacillus subtilis]
MVGQSPAGPAETASIAMKGNAHEDPEEPVFGVDRAQPDAVH